MNLLMWLRLLPSIIKATVALVIALEEVIPEDGWGSSKLEALDDILIDIIEAANDIDIDYSIIQPRVHKIAAVIVALLNKTGKFGGQ